MNDRKKIEKVLDMIQKSGVEEDKHVTPNGIYNAMSECRLFELAEAFALFANLITDIREVLEDDSEGEKLDILEVTLLSTEEAEKLSKEVRKAAYSWWLRSPGDNNNTAAFVYGWSGVVYDSGYDIDVEFGVRPALKLNPESSHLKSGDSFLYKGYEWEMIANDTALCKTVIGQCPFREDLEADDSNSYESSDIKKWLADWWEKIEGAE